MAGATRVPWWRFTWTTVVGYLPLSIAVTLLGSRLAHLSFADPLVWAATVPLLLLALAVRPLARRLREPAA